MENSQTRNVIQQQYLDPLLTLTVVAATVFGIYLDSQLFVISVPTHGCLRHALYG